MLPHHRNFPGRSRTSSTPPHRRTASNPLAIALRKPIRSIPEDHDPRMNPVNVCDARNPPTRVDCGFNAPHAHCATPFGSTLAFFIALSVFAAAQAPRITSPKEEFGFNFGDDYQLATYQQLAVLAETRSRIGSHGGAGDWQDVGRPSAPDGDRHVAREPQEPDALSRDFTPWPSPRVSATSRRRHSRARARPSSGSTAAWLSRGRQLNTLHSQRRAMTGSTIVARRAGM